MNNGKTFAALRESMNKKPSGKSVYSATLDGVKVVINNEKNSFVVYIDGDKLDGYKSEKEAKDMAKQFIKQYKG